MNNNYKIVLFDSQKSKIIYAVLKLITNKIFVARGFWFSLEKPFALLAQLDRATASKQWVAGSNP